MSFFIRVEQLIGKEKADKLKNACVMVFGVGGVGGYTVEALARSGVGNFVLIDNDVVEESNLNRQIVALTDTLGKYKTEVMKERILKINPDAKVTVKTLFYLPENEKSVSFDGVDYIVDAVDTVSAKINIIARAKAQGIPVISSMGTAGKTDISALKIAFVEKTSVCPLAKVVRKELKDRNITGVKAVYSTEESRGDTINGANGKHTPPSMIFVPAAAGLMIAGEVIKDITEG